MYINSNDNNGVSTCYLVWLLSITEVLWDQNNLLSSCDCHSYCILEEQSLSTRDYCQLGNSYCDCVIETQISSNKKKGQTSFYVAFKCQSYEN